MSLGFFTKYVGKKFGAVQNSLIKAIVEFDPETASEVDIARQKDRVEDLAKEAAKAGQEAEQTAARAQGKRKEFDQILGAVEILSKRQETATGADSAKLEKAINEALARAEAMKAEVEELEQTSVEDADYFKELQGAHSEAVEQWRTAERRLEQAKRDMQRATRDAERAKEQQERQERLSGLTKGPGHLDTALGAMTSSANEARQKASAARMTANALKGGADADNLLADAMKEASGAAPKVTSSVADRLAALKKKD